MTTVFQFRAFTHATERAARLRWLSLALAGLALLVIWQPEKHPGPNLCLLRHACGLPCPLCGLTRGASCALHGEVVAASAFSPLAIPVLVVVVLLSGRWAWEFAANRRLEIALPRRFKWWLVFAVQLSILGAWAYLLVCRREDDYAASWLGRLFGSN